MGKYLTTTEIAAIRDFIFRQTRVGNRVDPWEDFPHFLDNEEGNAERVRFFKKLGLGYLANHVEHVLSPLPGEVVIGKSIIRPIGMGNNKKGRKGEQSGRVEGGEVAPGS